MPGIDKLFKKAEILASGNADRRALEKVLNAQGIESSSFPENSAEAVDLIVCAGDHPTGLLHEAWEKTKKERAVLLACGSAVDKPESEKLLQAIHGLNRSSCLAILERNSDSPFADKTDKELLEILYRNEFELWYQPVMHGATGKIAGFEALIRWRDPETGTIVFPDRFIHQFESMDFIIPLGFWIIETACRQMKEWTETTGGYPLRVSINLSTRQFTCTELAERIMGIIDFSGLDPKSVALEITESAFMEDMSAANMMLLTLKSKNIQLYLDDFGTGFSSLSYLLHFPMNTIKIDQSFVKWMHVDEQSEEIVRSIISLAHNLKMTVVAEGVEFPEHIGMLRSMGCDYFQGYFYAKPLCTADAEEFIKKHM
jgi:EAL domain-containing protein (putative c-di-GMP-specific phosphodiesterase class I)